ncbi:PREDICTED: uncharacterized protein LOC108519233 isoform X1 [Rhinopithecus bieti]|uniref:uncharacterized protein LOC108519233 isoform X1 n=1 Tax=Rhinopithecus bieti TaxID=61621 RepID=UPI00083C33FE|nr:PREDICTED: uncharacterized protein LOC108519233 isoform X1 [Rhinopithecus bieti]
MLYDPIRRKAPPPIVHHSSQLLRGSCKTGVGGTLRSEPWTAALCAGGFYCEHPRILELPHGWASEPTGDQPVYGSGGPLTAVQSSGGGLACADRSSAVWTRQASVITFGVLWHFSGGCTIISPVLGRSSRGSMRMKRWKFRSFNGLSQVTQLVNGRARIRTQGPGLPCLSWWLPPASWAAVCDLPVARKAECHSRIFHGFISSNQRPHFPASLPPTAASETLVAQRK